MKAAWKEKAVKLLLLSTASTTILIVISIFVFLGKEAGPFVFEPGLKELLSTRWVPVSFQKESFDILPLITGSLLVTLFATVLMVPFGIGASVYISELAKPLEREFLKPFIEILAGIPSVVIGFFGPVVTDIAPGYDHITSAIGGTASAFYGASFLCYVTPREHLGLPNADDVRAGVIAAKIAAHAADIARGLKGAAEKDKNLSIARTNLDWKTHLAESLDPQTAEKMHREVCEEIDADKLPSADYCSMCDRNWCSVRINREIRKAMKHSDTTKV